MSIVGRLSTSAAMAALVVASIACSRDADEGAPPPAASDAGCVDCAKACPEGFSAIEGEAGCDAVLPAGACAPGTRPQIGSSSCVPVGVTACAPGFVKDPSGWGCVAVLPKTRCAGATREKLGEESCAPIGDCDAPFPPPGATHHVNANYTDAQLDATHFRTIADAIAVAPAGAVIAVDAGTYAEKIAPKAPVTVVGRCAAKTIFATTEAIGPGLRVEGVKDVVLRGVTLKGFIGGVGVYSGSVSLEDVLVESSRVAGLIVSNAGSSLRVARSVVRGTRAEPADPQATAIAVQRGASLDFVESVVADSEFVGLATYNAGSTAKVSRSVFRDGFARLAGKNAGVFGVGIFASDASEVTVEETAVLDHVSEGIAIARGGGQPAKGTVRRSVVRGVTRDSRDFARGIEVARDGTLVVEGTTVSGADEHEILSTEGGSADVRDTTTLGSLAGDPKVRAGAGLVVSDGGKAKVSSCAFVAPRITGIQVQVNGTLEADGVLVSDVVFAPIPSGVTNDNFFGFGVSVKGGSTVSLSRAAILRANVVGFLVNGASTTSLAEVVVADTRPSKAKEAGRAVSIQEGSKLTMTRSALLRNREAGLVAIEASSLDVKDSIVKATSLDADGAFGLGVLIADDSTGLFDRATITGSAGIGLATAAAKGVLSRSFLSKNAVAVHVQDGVELVERAPGDALDARTLIVSPDTRFVDNATKVGSGLIPLPSSLK
jgi:hypothetical protein